MGYNSEDSFINSIVGEGTHFRGHLELAGLLRIDGDFSGSIKTKGKVLVGKDGRADCNIDAGTVVVGGIVRGTISSSEKVIILSSAMVVGDIYAPRLIVEEGVVIDGTLAIRGAGEVSRPEPSPISNFGIPGAGRYVGRSVDQVARSSASRLPTR
ncbi:MAG: polymer-forming cytoskeletal family protein [Spirochaetes bacterium]|jgi:cytoskeletal protein CcmA (bactofilin family)|nr:polymer-forming cytoskeletal family protein [Spirochaetota bacterium]